MTPHHRSLSQGTKSRARALRAAETDAEKALWRVLRDRRLQSTKWRRQVPIGPYIVDFVCFEHRLVVECDGSQHGDSLHDAKLMSGSVSKTLLSRDSGTMKSCASAKMC
jgi:very-short-patch-repair endonuclease